VAANPHGARLTIRSMTDDDLAAVVAMETRAYAFPWTRGVFADCLRAGNACHVALSGTRMVGYVVLALGAGEAHLLNVCVGRDFQGRGFGRELIEWVLELAAGLDADVIFLEVRPSNRVAAHLYESLGFREVGVRRNYYPAHAGHEDARVLALTLTR
jgi:ribosomal-protein-alanine N-acetyltransferase